MGNQSRKSKISEILFLLSYALYIAQRIINNSMLGEIIPFAVKRGLKIGIIVIILGSVFSQRIFGKKWLIKAGAIVFFSLIVTIISGDLNLICLMLLVVAGAKIQYSRIVKTCIFANVVMLSTVVLLCLVGVIPNNVTSHYSIILNSRTSVYAYGFLHYSMPAYMIFYVSLLILFFKRTKTLYIVLGAANFVGYLLFTTKLPFFLYFIFALIMFVLDNKPNIHGSKKRNIVIYACIPIMFTIIVWLSSIYYSPSNTVSFFLNDILSDRLKQGQMGLQRFGISILGNNFEMVGIDTLRQMGLSVSDYIYVDSDLLYIPMRYGLIFFALIISVYIVMISRFAKEKEYYFLAYSIVIFIFSSINWCLIDVGINPILFVAIKLYLIQPNSVKQVFENEVRVKDRRKRRLHIGT